MSLTQKVYVFSHIERIKTLVLANQNFNMFMGNTYVSECRCLQKDACKMRFSRGKQVGQASVGHVTLSNITQASLN